MKRSYDCPRNGIEIDVQPALDDLLAGKEAGGRCCDANEGEGAAAAAVRCGCQRRRAASRRLLLLGELGVVTAPLKNWEVPPRTIKQPQRRTRGSVKEQGGNG